MMIRLNTFKPVEFIRTASSLLFFLFLISCSNKNETSQVLHVNKTDNGNFQRKGIKISDFKTNLTNNIGKEVLSIFQDRNNNYWFGTNTGAYCYDGINLIVFTVKDGLFQNQVQSIQEDKHGNIWFATGGYGVNRFDGKTITSYLIKKPEQKNKDLTINWKIFNDDLWFEAGSGAFRFYNDSLIYLPFPKSDVKLKYPKGDAYRSSAYGVYSLLKDRSGKLWFGTQANGVCCFDGKIFKWFSEFGLKGPAVLALFEDSNGNMWFGNNGKGLFKYDGNTLRNITEESGLSNPDFISSGKNGPNSLARVWAINEDNNGNIWIGTGDAGVWCYNEKGLKQYTTSYGLPDCGIETVYKDKKGEMWFGTNGGGVYKFNGSMFSKFSVDR